MSSERSRNNDEGWALYDRKADTSARRSLIKGLEFFDGDPRSSRAVDGGCGTGRDTVHLLEHGFEVYAFDSRPEAIEKLRAAVSPEMLDRLSADAVDFENVFIPECQLVNASFSLFFAAPPIFEKLWAQVCKQLSVGGVFCGHFLGPRDEWLTSDAVLTALSKEELMHAFTDFEIVHLHERDEVGPQVSGDDKNWHVFTVVARKRR